jgi:hypothetical protein
LSHAETGLEFAGGKGNHKSLLHHYRSIGFGATKEEVGNNNVL